MRWRLISLKCFYDLDLKTVPKLRNYHLCYGQLPNKLWFSAYLLPDGTGLVAIEFYTDEELRKRGKKREKEEKMLLEILDENGNVIHRFLTYLDTEYEIIVLFSNEDVEAFIRWICWYSPNGLLVDSKREFMDKLKPFKNKIDEWLWKHLPSHLVKPT